MLNRIVHYFLENRLITFSLVSILFFGGMAVAPFDWDWQYFPRSPIAVDAIPDIGENQQIVFTEWAGRSPQDVENQITYPLTTTLLGMKGLKTVRSFSDFGFSSVYLIFEEDIDFYEARTRILEKINALPEGTLPAGVQPKLGPDATALGQIFWYTLEGQDSLGNTTGGWDLHELRTLQDFYVRYALNAVEGVSEVASIGGYLKEYQVEVNPSAMQAHRVTLMDIITAVRKSNLDVGANTMEINKVEYYIRGVGYIKKLEDLAETVVTVRNNVPIRLKDVAFVTFGPASRRGILDKSGAEVVGGVVVARYGANPMQVIKQVKEKITEIEQGLPVKQLADGTRSQVKIVPFYDRSTLIQETLGTLNEALKEQILITVLVVLVMLRHLRVSLLISGLLPLAVLMAFIGMKFVGVDANIVSLSGIAIAIGTIVDVGIILAENIVKRLEINQQENKQEPLITSIREGSAEVSTAVLTSISTTIISFIPIFLLQHAEGKLFSPLAYTKTFALAASVFITLVILPTFAYWLFYFGNIWQQARRSMALWLNGVVFLTGILTSIYMNRWLGIVLASYGANALLGIFLPRYRPYSDGVANGIAILTVAYLLAMDWFPLGADFSWWTNFLFVGVFLALVLGFFEFYQRIYPYVLRWCLSNKGLFLSIPTMLILWGLVIWLGFEVMFGWLADGAEKLGFSLRQTNLYSRLHHSFPGIGKEFMPALDEGAFLLMPTLMPHAGVEESKETLQWLDMAVTAIPEVEMVVGKAGRVESALDPAPLSMFENIILYKSEYLTDKHGNKQRFKVDEHGRFVIRRPHGNQMQTIAIDEKDQPYIDTRWLIPDEDGRYFRQWRKEIKSPQDIWNEIVKATNFSWITSSPKLQPIETRLVMLQTGMRAPIGIKIKGTDLETIEKFGLELEKHLKKVPSLKTEAVFADRIVGKPYIEVEWNRQLMARYGIAIQDAQMVLETAIGGTPLSTTVEGRERYPITVRYPRAWRQDLTQLKKILIPTMMNTVVPLGEIASIHYRTGAQMIKSEDTFLVGYVLLDKQENYTEVEAVEMATAYLNELIQSGELTIPQGISYRFSGNYENQVRASRRLAIVIPLCLLSIFLLLYLEFKNPFISLMVFSGVATVFGGGFIMIWLYNQPWFLDVSVAGVALRELFQIHPVNLSVAVWVGFIALFGIADDDGVVMATYLESSFAEKNPQTVEQIRAAVLEAGLRRIRPCMMTTATAMIALLPVLTSSGRGADIMIPMAVPTIGGMFAEMLSIYIVPVLYAFWKEKQIVNLHKANMKSKNFV